MSLFKIETKAERERRQHGERMTPEVREVNRRFIDALREFLQLDPLLEQAHRLVSP